MHRHTSLSHDTQKCHTHTHTQIHSCTCKDTHTTPVHMKERCWGCPYLKITNLFLYMSVMIVNEELNKTDGSLYVGNL